MEVSGCFEASRPLLLACAARVSVLSARFAAQRQDRETRKVG